jgi:hypothetical protein
LRDKSNAARGLEKPARRSGEIPTKVLADPDPFRRLTYRAIAQHLGRVLATLPAKQLETINIVVAMMLNKLEVLGQSAPAWRIPRTSRLMLSDIRSYYGLTWKISLAGSQRTSRRRSHSTSSRTVTRDQGWQADCTSQHRRHRQDDHPAQSPGSLIETRKKSWFAKSLSVDGGQPFPATLIFALFCDLTTEKNGPIQTQTQRCERSRLAGLIQPIFYTLDAKLPPAQPPGVKNRPQLGKKEISVRPAWFPRIDDA